MNIEKIRNLTDTELSHQQRELADQLFKLKFQLNMGQTESLKKIREMRKDIARINTVAREKQIAAGNGSLKAAPVAAEARPVKAKAKAHKPAAAKKAAKKKTAATEKK
jgi:large subunit ribosomal protein L29